MDLREIKCHGIVRQVSIEMKKKVEAQWDELF